MTALRKKKGLSQVDLDKAVATSGDIIGRYERDDFLYWTLERFDNFPPRHLSFVSSLR